MKKRLKSICACLLAGTTLFISACKQETEEESENTTGNEVVSVNRGEFERGLHQVIYTETSSCLVENGVSAYKICVPAGASSELLFAAQELSDLLYESTGMRLPILQDNELGVYTEDMKIISLGDTQQSGEASIKEDAELDKYGYLIKTVGKSIFIDGNTDVAVTNGVYGLLEIEVEFDCFTNETHYVKETKTLSLKNYDVRDVPDLKIREDGTSFGRDPKTLRRMRGLERTEFVLGHTTVHSALKYLDPLIYLDEENPKYHPEWYSDDQTQLCYTAHGDVESLTAMKRETADIFIEYLKNYPNQDIIYFGHSDKITWCECDTCSASLEKYKANSAVVIQFCNDVAGLINEWMDSEDGKPYARDYDIIHLAYNLALDAPVVYNEGKGEYEPVDDSVVCAPHTCVMFAPIEMDYQYSIYDKINEKFLTAFNGWKVLSPKFNIYTYATNYNYFMYPFDCFNGYSDFWHFAAECNTQVIYELQQGYQDHGSTGWLALKNYIASKLTWNVNRNIDELIDKYFDYVYLEASDEMYTLFMEFRALSQANLDKTTRTSSVYGLISKPELWPLNTLERWVDLCGQALQETAYLAKIDQDAYDRIYREITRERAAYEYIIIDIYEDLLSPEYALALKLQTKADCTLNGIMYAAETGMITMASVYAKWGI